ncbi:MAG: peptide-methionine (S)-S-oxide reductase MsrA [Saprospiraceae bacterium]|nr:peptide-methionine (S)-S-oxide reductase MsrA [Saprospiraceae bacterium]
MRYLLFAVVWTIAACNAQNQNAVTTLTQPTAIPKEGLSKATFAGGCFWCTEAIFERTKGVEDVVSGYTGGYKENPKYEEVGSHTTGHAEAVEVYYDSTVIDYPTLVEIFFATHDPTQLNRQGPDVGESYRSAAFYRNEAERQIIQKRIDDLNQSGKYGQPIVTQVVPFKKFYLAEDYHQNYYEIHPENPYVQRVSGPKVEKFVKEYSALLKDKYKKG